MLHFMCIFAIAGTVFLMLDLEKKKGKKKKKNKQKGDVLLECDKLRVIKN